MATLVFLARTLNEVKVFGGEVFFDIDGKNVGKLSSYSQKIDLPSGNHTIKMYKSHAYDTFIGVAEQNITLQEDEILMVRYSCPMMISQPGNMVISEYSELKEVEAIKMRDTAIQKDFIKQEAQKKEAEEKYKHGVWIVIMIAIAMCIVYGIYTAYIFNT